MKDMKRRLEWLLWLEVLDCPRLRAPAACCTIFTEALILHLVAYTTTWRQRNAGAPLPWLIFETIHYDTIQR